MFYLESLIVRLFMISQIFQIGTIKSLLTDVCLGDVSVEELTKYGDFGIGTFDYLEGEMIILDGIVYKTEPNGQIILADTNEKIPFAAVTFFDSQLSFSLKNIENLHSLEHELLKHFPSHNYIYAVKISGNFSNVKLRCAQKIENKKIPLHEHLIKNQSKFNLTNSKGTIIGVWSPWYLKEVSVSGFHLHYINSEKRVGGHLVDFEMANLDVEIMIVKQFTFQMIDSRDFEKANLNQHMQDIISEAEKK